jgi:hypothetical protein
MDQLSDGIGQPLEKNSFKKVLPYSQAKGKHFCNTFEKFNFKIKIRIGTNNFNTIRGFLLLRSI